MNPEPTGLIRCNGGPLDGEWHSQGDAFEFDGRTVGLESGWYLLRGSVYIWELPARHFARWQTTGSPKR